MNHPNSLKPWIFNSLAASILLLSAGAVAQIQPSKPAVQVQSAKPAAPAVKPVIQAPALSVQAPSEKDIVATQMELIKLLRLSPKLTTVIEHDPSLLANQAYVESNNPQLGQFLTSHPEIARNPEFYLFTHLNGSDVTPDEALNRAVWPELH